MPPLPPIANVVRIVPKFTYNGQNCYNVMHYLVPSGFTSTDMIQWASQWITAWKSNVRGGSPTSLAINAVEVADLSPTPKATILEPGGSSNIGTAASPAMPTSVTPCVSLRTDIRGRSFRGRVYHVGMTEAQIIQDSIDAGFIATLESFYNTLRVLTASTSGNVANLVILSYYHLGALRGSPVATQVTSVQCDPFVDNQRRRLAGRGR